MDRADMTHPLTQREKVRQIIDGALNSAIPEPWEVANHATDAILTALASGSGDHAELARLKAAMSKSNDEICQSLGKALGYPWFKDDQRNFPGATEGNGVCVGDHVAESIADEAASRISALLAENAALRGSLTKANDGFEEYERKFYLEQDAREEAERKLAEAVGLVERSIDLMTDEYADTKAYLEEARTFLENLDEAK